MLDNHPPSYHHQCNIMDTMDVGDIRYPTSDMDSFDSAPVPALDWHHRQGLKASHVQYCVYM